MGRKRLAGEADLMGVGAGELGANLPVAEGQRLVGESRGVPRSVC